MKVSKRRKNQSEEFAARVGRALRRAARRARKTARMYGTPIHVWRNGRIVAENPESSTLKADSP